MTAAVADRNDVTVIISLSLTDASSNEQVGHKTLNFSDTWMEESFVLTLHLLTWMHVCSASGDFCHFCKPPKEHIAIFNTLEYTSVWVIFVKLKVTFESNNLWAGIKYTYKPTFLFLKQKCFYFSYFFILKIMFCWSDVIFQLKVSCFH